MPVTARLSRRFYDQFGDDVANELVEWFNQVDATYRLQLRELNELNFARFDAKLEQRMSRLEHHFTHLEAKVENCATKVEVAKLEERMNVTLRWMFLFWATTTAALVGIALR